MTFRDLLLTLNATRIVLGDSNRTEQIHIVEETTGRRAFKRVLERLRGTASGRELLRQRPELSSRHFDYDELRRLPAHTLGGAYVRHLDDNGLTAESQASETHHVDDPDIAYLMRRFRQTHDVWHPLTTLGVQPWQEVVIHAFSYGQLRLPVSAMIVSRSRSDRLRSTSISAECTPSACSSSSARPLRRPTWVTSGTWLTSVSACCASRDDSASVTPGFSRSPTSSVPSLNGGKKVVANSGTAAAASSTATPPAATAGLGRRSTAESSVR